jgi:hypothetical protein
MSDPNTVQGTLHVTEKIGIGTETPNAQLHIDADVAEGKVLVESGSNLFKLSVDGMGATIGTVNAVPFALQTDGSSRLTINQSGDVGIGKNPTFKLDVNGIINATEFNKSGAPWKIQTGDMEDNAIIATKIADNAVIASKIPDASITATKLATTALDGKADRAGSVSQNFATQDLTVQGNGAFAGSLTLQKDLQVLGNLDVTGITTFRNVEQHQGDLELGNEDTDQVRIHGVVRSTHSSSTLQFGSPINISGKITAEANWTGEEGALTLVGDKPTIRFTGGAISGNQSWILHLGSNGSGSLEFFKRTGAASWASALSLTPTGNVGIGTSFPTLGLDVRGNNGWIGSGDGSQTVGGWRLGRWPAQGPVTWVYLSRADQTAYQDLAVGALWAGGNLRFGSADDVAEMTPTQETDHLEPGDVVIIDHPSDDRVLLAKSDKPYDRRVAGVISDPDTAGLVIGGSHPNDRDRADVKPLALCGRVFTKVSLENGDIQPGDCLTTANTPGHAMKATAPGYILGKAMQAFNGNEREQPVGKIWVLVNLAWVGDHAM